MKFLHYVLATSTALLAGCTDQADSSLSSAQHSPVAAKVEAGPATSHPISFFERSSVAVLASEASLNTRRIWSPLLQHANDLRRRFTVRGIRTRVTPSVMASFELREGFQLTKKELAKALSKRGFTLRRVVKTGAVYAFDCVGAG